tara:strand:- start:3865 stop:3996 length:132 start_codon:yes stop_codon:yes gene_type:complete
MTESWLKKQKKAELLLIIEELLDDIHYLKIENNNLKPNKRRRR